MQIQSDSYCVPSRAFDRWDADNEEDEREEAALEAARHDARKTVADAISNARAKFGPGPQNHASVRQLASRAWHNFFAAERNGFQEPYDPNP